MKLPPVGAPLDAKLGAHKLAAWHQTLALWGAVVRKFEWVSADEDANDGDNPWLVHVEIAELRIRFGRSTSNTQLLADAVLIAEDDDGKHFGFNVPAIERLRLEGATAFRERSPKEILDEIVARARSALTQGLARVTNQE